MKYLHETTITNFKQNFRTALTLIINIITIGFLLMQSYSWLITEISTKQLNTQEDISKLSNEIRSLDTLLKTAQKNSISLEIVKQFDAQNKTSFSEDLSKKTQAQPNISPEVQFYEELKKEKKDKLNKLNEKQKTKIRDSIPPLPILFLTALGTIAIRLINKLTDHVWDKTKSKPYYTVPWLIPLTALIIVVVGWL